MGSQLGSGKGQNQSIKGTKTVKGCIEWGPFSINGTTVRGEEIFIQASWIEGENPPQGTPSTFSAGESGKPQG